MAIVPKGGLQHPMGEINRLQKDMRRNLENASRLAHSFGVFETTGWGEFMFEDLVEFEAPYVREPSVSYGAALVDGQGENVRTTRFPRTSGMVFDWDIDAHGFYRGAWCLVTVEDRSPFIEPTSPDPDPNYTIHHHFTFLGVASKQPPGFVKGDVKEV
jgi:hypothetical protein